MIRVLAAVVVLALTARPLVASETPVKTLDEINIEGELRLPQVLFITSRESERPLDFLALYGAPDAAALCESAAAPGALHVGGSEVPAATATTDDIVSEVQEEAPNSSKEDTP